MLQSVQPYNNIYNINAQRPYIMPPVNSQNSIQMPQGARNHILVDPVKVDYFVKQKENALPYITNILANSDNEAEITETLYITDLSLIHI